MSSDSAGGSVGRRVPLDSAIKEFERFLLVSKGVSVVTQECYVRHVRAMLVEVRGATGAVDFGSLSAGWVRSYVTQLGGRYAPQSMKLMATAVRAFLRCAWLSGWTASDLTGAVGPVITRRSGRLPRALAAEDLHRLLATPLRAATMKTLVGVMAVTGMRIGEVLQLRVGDLDLDHGVVLIANAKFGRQRLVQLHPSSCRAVAGYLRLPVRHRLGVAPERPVFVTSKGSAVHERTAHQALHQMIQHAGLARRAGARPRPHDLRHTFATQSMIDAYRSGRDPARTLTLLSVWLGHSNPADTYWYLQAAPEVAALAAVLLEPGTDRRGGGRS